MDFEEIYRELVSPPAAGVPVLGDVSIRVPDDSFCVEEIPAYLPSGTGEHLYLWVEKQGLSTAELVSSLAKSLGILTRDIGVAGQKDRRALTRQFVSVPKSAQDRLSKVSDSEFRILSVGAHGNKLRTGHLQGNRFQIMLRTNDGADWSKADAGAVLRSLQRLEEEGFPNYFGPQRFGGGPRTLAANVSALKSDASRSKQRGSLHKRRFAASAVQSAIFNLTLAERVRRGSWSQPADGDVVCSRGGIRPFLFADRGSTPESDVIPMGPIPGPKMMAATGNTALAEQAAMRALGIATDDFCRNAKLTPGARRRMCEFPREGSARLLEDGRIETCFILPAGSYATVVLAEFCAAIL